MLSYIIHKHLQSIAESRRVKKKKKTTSPDALHWGQTRRVAAKKKKVPEKNHWSKMADWFMTSCFWIINLSISSTLESPPLWVPACVTVSTIRVLCSVIATFITGGEWESVPLANMGREWGALCDKVTQQGWQMIFPEVFVSMCYVKHDKRCHFQGWTDEWVM